MDTFYVVVINNKTNRPWTNQGLKRHTLLQKWVNYETHSLSCMWSQSMSDFVWWPVSNMFRKRLLCRKNLLRLRCKLKLWLQSKRIYAPLPSPGWCLSYKPPNLKWNHWNKSWEFKILQQISSQYLLSTSAYYHWLLTC